MTLVQQPAVADTFCPGDAAQLSRVLEAFLVGKTPASLFAHGPPCGLPRSSSSYSAAVPRRA